MLLNTDIISNIIHDQLPLLKSKYGVNIIGIFGSYANQTQTENSDIDFYVEFEPQEINFLNIAGLWCYLELLFDKKIDLLYKRKDEENQIINAIKKEVIFIN